MADRVGFEPTCRSRDKSISSAPRYDRFDTCPHIYSLSVVPGKRRELQERTNKIIKLSNFQKPLFYRGLQAIWRVKTTHYFESDPFNHLGTSPNLSKLFSKFIANIKFY